MLSKTQRCRLWAAARLRVYSVVACGRECDAGCVRAVDVAIACCRRSADARPDDLYPDPDAAPLQAALAARAATSVLVSWDDPNVDWAGFSKVLVSSTWDSVDRPAAYLEWVRSVTAVSVLVNPASVLEWAIDKVYLRDLDAAGVPVIPTAWVAPGDLWESLPGLEFVVKSSISAGGRSTARYIAADPAARAHVHALQRVGQTVMIQEYLSAIDIEGETDLVFVEGTFSHAVGKRPALTIGRGVVERPWERMQWSGVVSPSVDQFVVAKRTIEVIAGRFGHMPVYGRVDLVSDASGAPLILEVELIDPYLSLDRDPESATKLAAALCRF